MAHEIRLENVAIFQKNLNDAEKQMRAEFANAVLKTSKQVEQGAKSAANFRNPSPELRNTIKQRKAKSRDKEVRERAKYGLARTVAARRKVRRTDRTPNGRQGGTGRGGVHRHLLELGTRNGTPAYGFMASGERGATGTFNSEIQKVMNKTRYI